MDAKPKVLFIGGPDVDARLDLMHRLKNQFDLSAVGSEATLYPKFAAAGFQYRWYRLSRRANPIDDLHGLLQLMAILKETRPDIVHTFATKPSVWGRFAAYLVGVPVIVGTLPGLGSLYANPTLATRAMRTLYQPLQKLACHLSDLTIFQNHDDARQFIETGVVSPQKTTTILGSGVATQIFHSDQVSPEARSTLRKELGILPDDIVVTMVSRVLRAKGVLEFMAAAQTVGATHNKVRFLLVGPEDHGVGRLKPDELARLKATVTWPGPRPDIPTVLACSDIFVLPSAYREGIPRVLLEAASMGLPIITTDSPGCNEVVSHGVNGFLVPVLNVTALSAAILTLVEQPALRAQFGRRSRQRAVERFDLALIASQTSHAYQQLLSGNPFSWSTVIG